MRRKGVLRISIEEGYIKYQNSYFINYITLFLERKFEINRIEKSPLVTIYKKWIFSVWWTKIKLFQIEELYTALAKFSLTQKDDRNCNLPLLN